MSGACKINGTEVLKKRLENIIVIKVLTPFTDHCKFQDSRPDLYTDSYSDCVWIGKHHSAKTKTRLLTARFALYR